ncbi:MAG: YdeI/OmpD-associated family protein, partial [Candidatus Dormibacteraeota bacterium]|nr:YdeI/OmpD-associated family protein [Candidatus Dormibacteraeota bacterium]
MLEREPRIVPWGVETCRGGRRSITVTLSACRIPIKKGETAVTHHTDGSTIRFDATLSTIDTSTVLRLPDIASKGLPSRGQVAVHGTINGIGFQTVLEPDGNSGHWMRVDSAQQRRAGIRAGDSATLDIEVTKVWPEPSVPKDLATALAAAPPQIRELWDEITPMARWEWVRWVNATKNPATRRRRVDVSISKMNSGKRRPCCFDLSACTDPD